jgi:hypothetical protein
MGKALREEVGQDPEYTRCALQGLLLAIIGPCGGRVTREHAMTYANKKIQEKWAIPPICAAHHGVDQYQDAPTEAKKEIRVWVALNRATDEELARFYKATPSYFFQRDRLNGKYGVYVPPPIPRAPNAIGVNADALSEFGKRQIFSVDPAVAAFMVTKKATKEELFEREVRAYARTNGVPLDEARSVLMELA